MSGSVQTEEGARDSAPFVLPAPLRWLDRIEEWISVGFLSLVLIAVSTQVIARYVFAAPLFWGDELARYSYVWMSFAAAAFITGRRSHVTIGLFDGKLSARHLRALECLAQVIVAITCLCVVVFSYSWLMKTAGPKSSALRMPMIYLYGGAWIAFGLMALHSLVTAFYVATGRMPALPPAGDTYE
ncbi:MAG: TRAP transporter small permease [Salipiger thiooxidans]|uniref:TRAP transporter small permease n=1 Tax=Salipiger thiooxidans TaxID=282683 RepID=UPI001CFAC293|nr:TRAP transporter small permease [Salipiger thiooxidans]MBR9839303.1 TRAP transporter small permease [Paracoccaceae bacterium]